MNPDLEILWQWRNAFALIIGLGGSLAYFTAVYFGFVGSRESRAYLLEPFTGVHIKPILKIFWYSLFGGFVAAIFQMPQGEFVPVQAFVLGATWPSIVSQLLSGRQAGPSPDELEQDTLERRRATNVPELDDGISAERRASQDVEELLRAFGQATTSDQEENQNS